MRVSFWSLLLLALAVISAAQDRPAAVTDADRALAAATSRFGLALFHETVSQAKPDAGVFISPLSVAYALSMTLNGAGGQTRTAMLSAMELSSLSLDQINQSFRRLMLEAGKRDSTVTFEIANSLWYRHDLPIRPEFVEVNKIHFDALVSPLDFSTGGAADQINRWVSDKTHAKIDKIVTPPIPLNMVMYLINAIYFKGAWSIPFDKHLTTDYYFHLLDGSKTTCRMMFNTDHFEYTENDLFQAVRLPYGDNGYAMLVFLPRPSVTVDTLIAGINDSTWALWATQLYPAQVRLGLPRFKFGYELTMNSILQRMGMAAAFDSTTADFSNIVKPGSLQDRKIYISEVKHKTFVQVDEKGTEAAAVTSVGMAMTNSYSPATIIDMVVDRPFVCAIYERQSGALLFIGRITNPLWKD
jgi:serine protease inhibitor